MVQNVQCPGAHVSYCLFLTDFGVINIWWHFNYSQTRVIRTLLIRHFRLNHGGNLKTLKSLPLTPILNNPFNSSPLLVRRKISADLSDELNGSDCTNPISINNSTKS